MKLQTQIPISPQENQIDYSSKVVLMGSCFVENIGSKLAYYQFNTFQNPFGILFNPVAIEQLIDRVVNQKSFTEKDIFYHNERWHCFEVHSVLSHSDKDIFLKRLNTLLKETKLFLKQSSHIIITYGTAWVYNHLSTQTVVANCHKVPQSKFEKHILLVEAITQSIKRSVDLLKMVNPALTCIFTVSPVRHSKEGMVENTRSKAHLLSAIHRFMDQTSGINNLQVFYFPSFEIIMDELRDYRFYEEDMIHPSNVAISIIWERFSVAWISPETEKLQKEIETIQKGLAHKPFDKESEEYKIFSKKLQQKIKEVKQKLPHIHFLI